MKLSSSQGDGRGTPIFAATRSELERYLSLNPRVGNVPLLPRPKDENKPIAGDVAAHWLIRAEKLAEVQKLTGGTFHHIEGYGRVNVVIWQMLIVPVLEDGKVQRR